MTKKIDLLEKKNATELTKLLGEKREALRGFRFGMKGSRTRNTKGGALLRKDIARIMYALHTMPDIPQE
jgi:ribosomal protein L29